MDQSKETTLTKEQIEYELALKHLHKLSLLKSLSEEGIDTSKLSILQTDEIKRIIDKRVQANNRANEKIRKIQQDTQSEMTEIDTELKKIIDTIKDEQGIGKQIGTSIC